MSKFKRNHYVPKWYQHRFLPDSLEEKKFYYLDLRPEIRQLSNGRKYKRNALLRWGPSRCFCNEDLYTTKFGTWESTEIEEKFFGKIDREGKKAVEYFSEFQHPSVNTNAFHNLLLYASIQKLRTPKGLEQISQWLKLKSKNAVLFKLQEIQQLFCAIWTECVWSIVDASQSYTKFILSDHPVTVFNENCFPGSKWCRGSNDPDISLSGTQTLFPLSLEKMLILTNLSWARNPYGSPLKPRPNPKPFRSAMFSFQDIQTCRVLTDVEVNHINSIIKQRAFKYVAATEREWLYPERRESVPRWDKLGRSYLLMPDPRSMSFSSEVIIGYKDGKSDAFDAYGRKPWQRDYDNQNLQDKEWGTFHAFQGEYARMFGPGRRGQTHMYGKLDDQEDSPEYHAYHLSLEQKHMPKNRKRQGWVPKK